MSQIERCFQCDTPTGRAGIGEDSLHDDEGRGPFCEACWNAEQTALSQPAPEHPVITAAIQWFCERQINDWDEADLAKAVATHTGDWPGCDECDHECDEPCMPCAVAEVHASIDNRIAQLVHDGKLYAYEGYAPPAGWIPNVTPAPRRKAQPAPQGVAEVMVLVQECITASLWDYGFKEAWAAVEQAITAIVRERSTYKERYELLKNADLAQVSLEQEREITALKARVAELEGDVARLDWLEAQINKHGAIHLHDGNNAYGLGLGLRPGPMVRTLRYAIDDAKGPHHG